MMSESVHSLWLGLLRQRRADFLNLEPSNFLGNIPLTNTVDGYLRLELESFSQGLSNEEDSRELARLRYDRINGFTRPIDRALNFVPPINLAGLVSFGILVTIQSVYQRRLPLRNVVGSLRRLDHALPLVDFVVPTDATSLHNHLWNIFHEYTECLLYINRVALDCSSDAVKNEIQNRVREARALFDESRRGLENELKPTYSPEPTQHQSQSSYTPEWQLDHQEFLGGGSFGKVYRSIEISTGQVYAVKRIPRGRDSDTRRRRDEKVRNECNNMRKLPHPHIVKICFFYPDQECWNIVMDVVADSNLSDFFDHCCRGEFRNPASLDVMLPWMGCLIDALNYAHKAKVIHNDIKPANILIKGNDIYLGDFGLSMDFAALDSSRGLPYTPYGTLEYKSPEMSRGAPPSRKADVFSLGCVFAEMLTVHRGLMLEEFRKYRLRSDVTWPAAFRNNLPAVARWLHHLRDTGRRELSVLFDQTLDMIEEHQDQRVTAENVRNDLLGSGYADLFFCEMHSP